MKVDLPWPLGIYRALMGHGQFLLKYHLKWRVRSGKEDPLRLEERYGKSRLARPLGNLVWLHGASVGESLSLLPLIKEIQEKAPHVNLLVTTGTTSSARFMAQYLPEKVIHQYIPLDSPKWIENFLSHWQPASLVLVESELWPNLILEVRRRSLPLFLVNGSLSEKSYKFWEKFPQSIRALCAAFQQIFTPSATVEERYRALGIQNITRSVNLKFLNSPPPYNKEEALTLKTQLQEKIFWVAASTHHGEEEILLKAHKELQKGHPNLVLILTPRYPHRVPELIKILKGLNLSYFLRSQGPVPPIATDVWIFDTFGELGLAYHLSSLAFVGGSFVPLGGHNPIEAIQHEAVVIMGPHHRAIKDSCPFLMPHITCVDNQEALIEVFQGLLANEEGQISRTQEALRALEQQREGIEKITQAILQGSGL